MTPSMDPGDPVIDFRTECDELYALLADRDASAWDTVTQFKEWTFRDILGHLLMFDLAARLAVENVAELRRLLQEVNSALTCLWMSMAQCGAADLWGSVQRQLGVTCTVREFQADRTSQYQ